MPLPFAAGSGRSTPPHVRPAAPGKKPRIASRKISFEPPARIEGRDGLIATNVSLCGPHSFDTFTFAPTFSDGPPVQVSAPCATRNSYLFHQVGLSELFVCATAGADSEHASNAAAAVKRKRAMRGLLVVVWTDDSARRQALAGSMEGRIDIPRGAGNPARRGGV